ncbi:MAG: hypothetical protein LBR79_04535 [Oscillospiraceae bacterium]|nr:hypothetical protein [Oscillospiraceae bacterium]
MIITFPPLERGKKGEVSTILTHNPQTRKRNVGNIIFLNDFYYKKHSN